MKKYIAFCMILLSGSAFASDALSTAEQLCGVRVGNDGKMLNLSTSQWASIPSDGVHDEILLFDNGQQVFINQQSDAIQEDIKAFYEKNYDVYVCVGGDGKMAPVYKRN
ncbi:hypothetical protein HPX47_004635 [Vibrio alginolyticus]|nr:hypothetical protein [Vibrio alginolyticus]